MSTPDTARGATTRALLYFLASTPFLVILALGLHHSGALTLDRVIELLHGRKPEVAAGKDISKAEPVPPRATPRPPTPDIPPSGTPQTSLPFPSASPRDVPPPPTRQPPPEGLPPQPNQPPRVSAELRVAFAKGERTKVIEVKVADESRAEELTFSAYTSGAKLFVDGRGLVFGAPASTPGKAGPDRSVGIALRGAVTGVVQLAVTPEPGIWGDAVVYVRASDPEGRHGEAAVRVVVPEPALTVTRIPDIILRRGLPAPPVRVRTTDESPIPRDITLTAVSTGDVLPPGGAKVEKDRILLAPVKDRLGTASVSVVAKTTDGREARATFRVSVTPPVVVGCKATVTPADGTERVNPEATPAGGNQPSVPYLYPNNEVRVTALNGDRVQVSWGPSARYTGWVDERDLTPSD